MDDQKKINARTQKWREMLIKGLKSDPSLLKKRVRKGVPPPLRMLVWPILADLATHQNKAKYKYQELLKMESISSHDICLDVPRTFPQQKAMSLRNSLYCVLKALSIVHPEVGYCQGMNFLTMRLLQIMQDETTFWMMDHLLHNLPHLKLNYRSPQSVELQNYTFTKLFQKNLKQLHNVCEAQMIQPLLFTTPWFITLFSSLLPKQHFCRVFQCLLNEGYKIVYRTGLAIMKLKEKYMVENSLEKNIVYVNKTEVLQKISADEFLQLMFSFSVSRSEIKQQEEEYRNTHKDKFQKMQRQARLAQQRRKDMSKRYEEVEDEQVLSKYEINISQFQKMPFQLLFTEE